MAKLLGYPRFRALLQDGSPAVGYKLFSYIGGTTSLKDTYSDQTGAVANANPVIMDGAGEADVWLGDGAYKFVLTDDSDVQIWSIDNVQALDSGVFSTLTVSGDSSLQALSVTSFETSDTTKVTNLNADSLDDGDWTIPGTIGSITPNSVVATTLQANTSLKVGSTNGTPLTQIRIYPAEAMVPSAVNQNTTSEQTFTITGLDVADMVIVNKPTHQAGLGIVNARVSAANTLAITYMNNTGSPITPTSENYKIIAIRS